MLISPIEEKNRVSSKSSARRPCYKLLSSGGRGSAEAAGRDLPHGFGDDLVVDHGHQDQVFGYYQVFLHDVNRACVLTIIVNAFLKRKNKYLVLFLPFCYNAQDEGGRDFVLQTHIPNVAM